MKTDTWSHLELLSKFSTRRQCFTHEQGGIGDGRAGSDPPPFPHTTQHTPFVLLTSTPRHGHLCTTSRPVSHARSRGDVMRKRGRRFSTQEFPGIERQMTFCFWAAGRNVDAVMNVHARVHLEKAA